MIKNKTFAQVTPFLYCFLRQSLLLSVVILLTGFLTNAFGQVAIPLLEINRALNDKFNDITDIKGIGEQLFVGTSEGLWVFSKDGKQAVQVVSSDGDADKFDNTDWTLGRRHGLPGTVTKGGISSLGVVGNRLFAFTYTGLWIISKDGKHATRVKQVKGDFAGKNYKPLVAFDCLIVTTNEGLWMVSNDGEKAEKIERVQQIVDFAEAIWGGGQLLVDRKSFEYLFRQLMEFFRRYENRTGRVDGFKIPMGMGIIGEQLYICTNEGLWFFSPSGSQPIEAENVKEKRINSVEVIGEQLYICTDIGLWLFNKDANQPAKVDSIKGEVKRIVAVVEQLFVATPNSLLVLSKDSNQHTEVQGIKESPIYNIEAVGRWLFVRAGNGLWIVNQDGSRATRVESIEPRNERIVSVSNYVYIMLEKRCPSNNLYNLVIYRVDLTAKISTELSPSGWWATTISSVLSSNWMPVGKVEAEAFYSSEENTAPYDSTVPSEFRFAIANGDALPPDDKFSTAEQFSYEIGLGNNNVHYWVKDKWGNTFEHKGVYRGVPSQYFIAALPFILSIVFILLSNSLNANKARLANTGFDNFRLAA